MNKLDSTKKHIPLILFIILIITQTVLMCYISAQKQEFHIDEIYSYILSNSYDTDKLGNADNLKNRWVTPEDWDEFTTVQEGERFTYGNVYKINSTDAHPPLYYWILHSICSLFPNSFSMWYGISINIFFFVLSAIVIYLISKRLIKNVYLALLPTAIWGFSTVAFNIVTFIRMYALLTFITLLSFLIHIKLYQQGQNLKWVMILFAVTFLGAMTQYYFIVAEFCFAAAYCIYKIAKKEYKNLFIYGGTQLTAIILLFIAYPAAYTQITGSSTNNIGNEVSATFFNLDGWTETVEKYITMMLNEWGKGLNGVLKITFIVTILSVAALIVTYYIKKRRQQTADKIKTSKRPKAFHIWVMFLIELSIVAIISKMSNNFVYLRYIYHVIPLFVISAVMLVEYIVDKTKLSLKTVASVLLIISIINAFGVVKTKNNDYLYMDTQKRYQSIENDYGDIPVVLVNENNNYVLTGNYTFLKNYSNVYVTPASELSDLTEILKDKDTSNGFLLMVWTDTYWANGYNADQVISQVKSHNPDYKEIKSLGDMRFTKLYYCK